MGQHCTGMSVSMKGRCKHRNEPAQDKTYKMACVPSEDSDQPGHLSSLISL